MSALKFSGHDTFYCRQQWLLKGYEHIEKQRDNSFSNLEESILELGVGKNMVQAIQYWLRVFGLIDENKVRTNIANLLFNESNGFDRYLEDEGTLWLLQYLICKTDIASIYRLIFSDYSKERISYEFDERQIINFIKIKISESKNRETSENTLISDFKVFIQSYNNGFNSKKSLEDDFNSPLLELNLISSISKEHGITSYKLNRENRANFPVEIFGYCLLDFADENNSLQYKEIRESLGAFFVFTNEGLEIIIDSLCEKYKNEFVFNDDAGIRQIQFKNTTKDFKESLLANYYNAN
jgi:hypothetical protein